MDNKSILDCYPCYLWNGLSFSEWGHLVAGYHNFRKYLILCMLLTESRQISGEIWLTGWLKLTMIITRHCRWLKFDAGRSIVKSRWLALWPISWRSQTRCYKFDDFQKGGKSAKSAANELADSIHLPLPLQIFGRFYNLYVASNKSASVLADFVSMPQNRPTHSRISKIVKKEASFWQRHKQMT